MRKVFTLFCVLMAAFFSIGVANAQSPVAFQTSPEPTGDAFDANTHWYFMTVDNKFVTTENKADDGILLTVTNELTTTNIHSDKNLWCIVGEATSGYKFYNKGEGTKVFLAFTNKDINEASGGKARAQMCATSTSNETESTGYGTTFEIKTKSGETNIYYVCLKGASNRYWNYRNPYLAYWVSGDAYGNSGSQVRLYTPENYWVGYYESLAANITKGSEPFTYPESAVNTFSEVVKAAKASLEGAISHAQAQQVQNTLESAKTPLRKSINGPAANKIYKLLNQFQGNYVHAPSFWTAGQVFPLNRTANDRSIGFIFEKNADGTYKVKSADTGMYVGAYVNGGYTSTASKDEAVNCYIYAYRDCDSKVIIGTTNDLNGNEWFHGNGTKLFNYPASGANGCWQCTEVSVEDFKALTDARITNINLLPGLSGNETVNAALTTYNSKVPKTVEDWNSLVNTVNGVLNGKYYRINNQRATYKLLATNGTDVPKMHSIADGEKLVSSLWKFEIANNGGFKLNNANTPGKYVAVLTAAPAEANAFTTSDNADVFTMSVEDDHFLIKNRDNHLMNAEDANTKTYPINYWDNNSGGGTKWQINEVNSLEVDLNNAGNGKSYASVYLPFSISSVNDGVKVFVANEPETNEVTFTETTHGVKAENGFLLISDNAATTTTATVNIGDGNAESKMLGTLTDLDLTAEKSTYRVFGKNSSGVVGFFTPSSTLNEVKANRGYFKVSNGGALRLNFEDSVVSGIDAIVANQALHNAPIFDLSGRRVMNTVKGGLYIQNGRKFIVK